MRQLVLFNYDWDQQGFARLSGSYPHESAGFDLFSFPSNAQLIGFDIERFVSKLARLAPRKGWSGVVSNHEQFGALAAAMLAERMGWPGTPVKAVLACQHKLYARAVLERVCPDANCGYERLNARYGQSVPAGLNYPAFVKPVKAAFSVLARIVHNHAELQAHTRFGWWEQWVIRHLVEPFERVIRDRLPHAGTAHSLMLEQPMRGQQYNLDGYVFEGKVRGIGVVDAVHYPGTQAFMRFELPSQLPNHVQARALDVASRFLKAVGFNHGLFNMEFFFDAETDSLQVIEFNPRMASQFSDLYRQVRGIDLHQFAFELSQGRDPAWLPVSVPASGAACSFVYRSFDAQKTVRMPSAAQLKALQENFPESLLLAFPKSAGERARDLKWLGSYRYGILHLAARDERQLRQDCLRASEILGWPAPYADQQPSPKASPLDLPAHALSSAS